MLPLRKLTRAAGPASRWKCPEGSFFVGWGVTRGLSARMAKGTEQREERVSEPTSPFMDRRPLTLSERTLSGRVQRTSAGEEPGGLRSKMTTSAPASISWRTCHGRRPDNSLLSSTVVA
jgi:hypothetical protein